MQTSSKQHFVQRFEDAGPEEFYLLLYRYAQTRVSEGAMTKGTSPEVELLNYSNQFLQIYRRENKEIYSQISHAFRRAAHKAYRMMLKKGIIKKSNKFLNVVG